MSENDDNDQGPGGRAPLSLKPRGPVSAGTVKQSFSHGRTKTVVVETKRRRAPDPAERQVFGERPRAPAAPEATRPSPAAARPVAPPRPPAATAGGGLNLSDSERAARQRALDTVREADERRQAEAARQRSEEEAHRRAEIAASEPAPAPAAAGVPLPTAEPLPVVEPVVALEPAPAAKTEPTSVPVAASPTVDLAQAPSPPPVQAAPQPRVDPVVEPAASAPAEPAAPRPWDRLTKTNEPRREERAPPPRPPAAPRAEPRAEVPTRPAGAPARPAAFGERAGSASAGHRSGFGERPRAEVSQGLTRAPRPDVGGAPRPAAFGDRARTGAASGGFGERPRAGAPASGFGDRAPRSSGLSERAPILPRPEGGFGARPARPEGSYGSRPAGAAPTGARPGGGGYGQGAPREGDTVRYSALSPRPAGLRPAPGASRPGLRPAAAPSAPELTKTARTAAPRAGQRPVVEDDEGRRGKAGLPAPKSVLARARGTPARREGRLTIQVAAGDGDSAERMRSLASVRRAREREREKRTRGEGGAEQARAAREVVIPDALTVQDLAQRMATRAVDVIKYLMRQGTMLKINDVLDADTAELIASEFGHSVRRVSESDVEQGFISAQDAEENTIPRPPVVAVMGHVDHGKTSLLDALRSTDVASGEHGGITQHIGAYQVRLSSGDRVTFLDTPGHAAFSAMRARGANVTDIVILVVAADDGVMPQTIEAISHAKAAGAPMIVAINKMDKPDANPTKVINELLQYEVVTEALGGDTQVIEVSALKKTGLDTLVEAILLQAEVLDLRANPDRSAEGVVIEAKLDKGRGPVATMLIKRGSLKRGDIVVAGSSWGKVRALINERNEQVPAALPSDAVELLGLDQAPSPGDTLAVVENEARARELTEYRDRVRREKAAAPVGAGSSLADMMAKLQNKKVSELPLVIKSDVQGSAEAISNSLDKLSTDEVKARILHSGVGAITESDVQLAKGSGAPIIGFNVRASAQARALAERESVEIRYYAIIYDLLDDIKGVMSGMLAPLQRETFLGNAEVLEVFDISKVGKIAGCRVTEGVVRRGARTRIIRNNVVIQEMGTLQTLKRFKDEVPEVVAGQECGIHFAGFQDIKQGDLVECFTVELVQRSL